MKRIRMRLGVILAAAMVVTGIPVPAMAYVPEDTAAQEGSLLTESDDPLLLTASDEAGETEESLSEEAGEALLTEDTAPEPSMVFEEEEGAEMSLKSLADQYDTVYNDTTGEGIKIVFVSDNHTGLSSDALERLTEADEGRDRIKIGEDGVVTQAFDRNDEDKLAPNVYTHDDGKQARGERTWYVTERGKTYIERVNGSGIDKYRKDGSPLPGYIIVPTGYEYDIYRETEIKKYFSADSIVSQVQSYEKGGTVRLFPNWQTPVNVIFDEESLKGAENPNADITDYVPYEKLKLDPLEEVPGYAFRNWQYKFEGESVLHEAVAGTGDDEGKFIIDTQSGNGGKVLTVYAEWTPVKYRITYKGVKVQPVSDNSAGKDPGKDTFAIDGVEMEVVKDSLGDVIDPSDPSIAGISLPTFFTVDETTTLPTADEINSNLTNIDPDFTSYNEFMCWSASRKFKRVVNTLGKDGDILYGDTVLYVIYTAREPIPELSANKVADDNEFHAAQVNTLDLLDTDDYAIIDLIGTSLSADPDTVVLSGNAAKYFELCRVDARKAGTGHGYATIGIKLKDKDDEGRIIEDTVVSEIQKKSDMRSLTLKFIGVDKRKDDKGEPVSCELGCTLKTSYKLPAYKLKSSKGTIYTAITGGDKAKLLVSEKDGRLTVESYGGDWEADYVVKKDKAYEAVPASEVSVSVKGNDFAIEADKACKGKIRLRNSGWVKGAYVYLPYAIAVNAKTPSLLLNPGTLVLNEAGDNEVSTTTVTFKGGMKADPSGISIDETKLPSGISAEYKNGTITVKRTGTVKKGSYKIAVNYKGIKKGKTLTVKVMDTDPEKAVKKIKAKGKIDSLMGGSLYFTPKVTGYAGTIKEISVEPTEGGISEFDVAYKGGMAELYSTYDYRPSAAERKIKLNITMTTGRILPYLLKVKPGNGNLKLDVYDAAIKLHEKDEDNKEIEEVTVYTPVIATYTYDYYMSDKTKVKRSYTIDLTRDNSADLISFDAVKGDGKNEIAVSYDKGVIGLTNKIDAPEKGSTYTFTVSGVFKLTGKKISSSYKVLLSR